MLIDAFQLLSMEGVSIRDFQYTGMGSIYFIDYILFHKFLGLDKMVSVEASPKVEKRVSFNRPFRLVQVKMARVGDYIPELSSDRKHILWLDYDSVLSAWQLQDIALAGTYLSQGSILLVTVDVEPPLKPEHGGTPSEWRKYFEDIAYDYVDPGWTDESFALSNLAKLNAEIIVRAFQTGLVGRPYVEILPLFNFEYADGHKMITVGGMVASETEKHQVAASRLPGTVYYRGSFELEPYRIRVPRLTRKERLFLDSQMPAPDGWVPKDFELDLADIRAYSEIYRFFPAYAELLL